MVLAGSFYKFLQTHLTTAQAKLETLTSEVKSGLRKNEIQASHARLLLRFLEVIKSEWAGLRLALEETLTDPAENFAGETKNSEVSQVIQSDIDSCLVGLQNLVRSVRKFREGVKPMKVEEIEDFPKRSSQNKFEVKKSYWAQLEKHMRKISKINTHLCDKIQLFNFLKTRPHLPKTLNLDQLQSLLSSVRNLPPCLTLEHRSTSCNF